MGGPFSNITLTSKIPAPPELTATVHQWAGTTYLEFGSAGGLSLSNLER
jgi:hypothetical protein